jgi:hypothetical protein
MQELCQEKAGKEACKIGYKSALQGFALSILKKAGLFFAKLGNEKGPQSA